LGKRPVSTVNRLKKKKLRARDCAAADRKAMMYRPSEKRIGTKANEYEQKAKKHFALARQKTTRLLDNGQSLHRSG
jgi:hypothetical protein